MTEQKQQDTPAFDGWDWKDGRSIYDRIRGWRMEVEDQTGKPFTRHGHFTCMVSETKELHDAKMELYRLNVNKSMRDRNWLIGLKGAQSEVRDAVGDIAVTAIVMHHMTFPDHTGLETIRLNVNDLSMTRLLGLIADGLRHDDHAAMEEGCYGLLARCQKEARENGWDFINSCMTPVARILEGRLKEGYRIVDGSAIKAADQAQELPSGDSEEE